MSENQNNNASNARLSIQLISFAAAALYFELAIIRFTTAEVLYLGYFSNFILISAFVGLGLGFLSAQKNIRLDRVVPFVLLFLFALVLVTKIDVSILKNHFGLFFFGNITHRAGLPGSVLLFILFIATALLFAGIGNRIASVFRQFRSLKAYTRDIVGSLFGIALFSLQSYAAAGPVLWIFTGLLLLLVGYSAQEKTDIKQAMSVVAACVCTVVLIFSAHSGVHTIWSTYQKLEVAKVEDGLVAIFANGIVHQLMYPLERAKPIHYGAPYRIVQKQQGKLDDVLIIGAGSGTDVAVALSYGAKYIDAVDIDRHIIEIGKQFHPNKPYADSRVRTHATDGRRFLQTHNKKYDAIVFALPDSLMRLSAMTSVRLESYLFTLEAFNEVKNHLKPNGVFVMYNQYRWPWLVNKLATMVETVFERPPHLESYGETTVIAVGSQIAGQSLPKEGYERLATDDWPFIYMQRPGVHWLFVGMIAVFLLVSLLGVYWLAPNGTLRRPDWPFFFMGAAFLLLETKSLTFFSLLFGTTWIVNSLAFFGILLSVLVANLIVQRFNIRARWLLYACLFVSLLVAYLTPTTVFLTIESGFIRYLSAVALAFTPIFFANLIFSREFRDTEISTRAFGWNLIGAVVGGGLEYLSLVIGLSNLFVLVGLCYLLAGLTTYSRSRAVESPV